MARKAAQNPSTTRSHSGHSHSHNHDNSYLTSSNKSDAGVRITRIGLYVNLGMAIFKGLGGWYFNSKALLADAIHSLTDLISDFMTLATVSFSLKPPSERFPNGYGKVESLGSLGVSGILLAGGCAMGYAAIMELCVQFLPGFQGVMDALGLGHGHSHSHSHGAEDLGPNINAAWLAAASIAVKEWLYRATLKVAKERKSSVLASNAYHHRVDSLTAFVALLMIGGSNVLNNASWMDPVGGLVISLMIIQAGYGNTRDALLELADVGVDESMKKKVAKYADQAISANSEGKASLRQVQGIKAGQNYMMDVDVEVPGQLPIAETKKIEEAVRLGVGSKVRGVKRVKVRFVAGESGKPDLLDEFVPADMSPRSSPEPEDEGHHGHSHTR
ncbi:MAG: hypothetical protein M1828_000937 [Chrysothrix sp. TS-e1954]|nr:MAG: hypothetical protein M1828_000937 [Chrysothrix sp. TS-e1954]